MKEDALKDDDDVVPAPSLVNSADLRGRAKEIFSADDGVKIAGKDLPPRLAAPVEGAKIGAATVGVQHAFGD